MTLVAFGPFVPVVTFTAPVVFAAGMAAFALVLPMKEAFAEDGRPAALGWVRAPGAEGCIGTSALGQAVEARLGKAALVSASRARVSIEGRIAPAEGAAGWRVSLTVADEAGKVLGTRALSKDGADCRAMDEDVILTVALLIDPEAALSAPAGAAAPSAGIGAAPPAAPVSSSAPAAPPATHGLPGGTGTLPATGTPAGSGGAKGPSGAVAAGGGGVSRRWNAALLVGAVAAIGPLPEVGVGAQMRALVTPSPYFAFQIGGSVWAPQSASFGDAGGRFFMALGALSGCPLTGVVREFRYGACLGAEAGILHAGGLGFPLTLQHDDPIVNGTLEGRVVRRVVGPFAGSLGMGLSVPFLRKQYYYLDSGGTEREVFLASPVTGYLDLLVGFDL